MFSNFTDIGRSRKNLNLDHHLTAQPPTLEFINVLSHVSVPLSAQHPSQQQATPSPLKPILDLLSESLGRQPSAKHAVILDDITTLEWIGFELLDVMRFARALRAVCVKVCLDAPSECDCMLMMMNVLVTG